MLINGCLPLLKDLHIENFKKHMINTQFSLITVLHYCRFSAGTSVQIQLLDSQEKHVFEQKECVCVGKLRHINVYPFKEKHAGLAATLRCHMCHTH